MKIILTVLIAGASCSAATPPSGQPEASLPLLFASADSAPVAGIELGRVEMAGPRGPLGLDEVRPEWRRTSGLASLTHASIVTVPFIAPKAALRANLDTLHGTAALQ